MADTGRLVVMLAAEVVGYSSLIASDEEGTLERLEAHRHEFLNPKIAEHYGRIVRAAGDSLLVELASPMEAIQCAVELQRGMIDRNIGAALDRRIAFRIGVHIGEVTVIGDDLVSRAVAALPLDRLANLIRPGSEINSDASKVAAGVTALADPGGICISDTVWDAIRDQLTYRFADIGKQKLDIGAAPLHCYAMSAESVTSRPRGAAPNQVGSASQGDVSPSASGTSPPPLRTTPRKVVLTAAVVATIAAWMAGGWAFLNFYRPPAKPAAVTKSAEPERPALVAADNLPKPPEPGPPSELQSPPTLPQVSPIAVSADKTLPVGDDEELVNPAARELIMQGWALYHLPYTLARWQDARRDFERALELNSRSSGARIGLASILSAKLADGWSPVLQEDMPRAEQLLLEVLHRGSVSRSSGEASAAWVGRISYFHMQCGPARHNGPVNLNKPHPRPAQGRLWGRTHPLNQATPEVSKRRILLVPPHSGGGRLTEQTPAVQPRRRERVKVPQSRHWDGAGRDANCFFCLGSGLPLIPLKYSASSRTSSPYRSVQSDRCMVGSRSAPIGTPHPFRKLG